MTHDPQFDQARSIQTIPQEQPSPITPEQPKKTLQPVLMVLGGFLLLSLGGIGGYYMATNPLALVGTQACTMEAKICPDGSSVGRTGPTCEFAPCPTPTTQISTEGKTFIYNDFSISYPDDWVLQDMSTGEDFPLKERLYSLYSSDKVIALSKNRVHVIITIEHTTEGGSEGIFASDEEYNNYVSGLDRVVIGNSTFYLSKRHEKLSSLSESHAGPYGWSALVEYIPNKQLQSGETFRGYDTVIKRNGYSYNFIIVSAEGGTTNPQLQKEIIGILETINW